MFLWLVLFPSILFCLPIYWSLILIVSLLSCFLTCCYSSKFRCLKNLYSNVCLLVNAALFLLGWKSNGPQPSFLWLSCARWQAHVRLSAIFIVLWKLYLTPAHPKPCWQVWTVATPCSVGKMICCHPYQLALSALLAFYVCSTWFKPWPALKSQTIYCSEGQQNWNAGKREEELKQHPCVKATLL